MGCRIKGRGLLGDETRGLSSGFPFKFRLERMIRES